VLNKVQLNNLRALAPPRACELLGLCREIAAARSSTGAVAAASSAPSSKKRRRVRTRHMWQPVRVLLP